MRLLFAFLFSGLIGVVGISEIIYLLVTDNENILITGYNYFFIKYSLIIGVLCLVLTVLLIPILAFKKIINIDYYNADGYTQAKTTFILGSLSMPGFIFLSIAGFSLVGNPIKIYIMDGLLLLIYISSIINFIRRKRGN